MLNNGLVVCERSMDVKSCRLTPLDEMRRRGGERPSGRSHKVRHAVLF